jgi:dihydrodipicolinate synthase/N-acetylneuraminate lyase
VAIQGVWPACPTVLGDGRRLDEGSTRRIARFLADAGVDGLWLLGGGGEGVLHSDDLRRGLVEVVLDEVGPSLPVIVGISAEGTERAIARYRPLADLPIAAVFATPPYYYACSQREVVEFYRALAGALEHPLIAYNNPYAARIPLDTSTAMALAEVDGIAGIKDSGGDFLFTQALLSGVGDNEGFVVLQGFDQLAAASVLAGADGVVNATACFMPRLLIELTRAARGRDVERAFALQRDVVDILDRLAWDPQSESAFIRGVKTCLEVMGLCSAHVMAPLESATEEERARTREALRDVIEHAGTGAGHATG